MDEDKTLEGGELSHVPEVFSSLSAVTNILSRDLMPLQQVLSKGSQLNFSVGVRLKIMCSDNTNTYATSKN